MTGQEVVDLIADTIHDDCGSGNCGALEDHANIARSIMFALADVEVS